MIEYDVTAGLIQTPAGMGRYMGYDSSGKVAVEMDYLYIVLFPAEDCYPDRINK